MSTIEELHERKSSGSGVENREYSTLRHIKYWNNLRTQESIFLVLDFYYALLTRHVSAPFGGHLEVVHTYIPTQRIR
jgi:hypothetical protein